MPVYLSSFSCYKGVLSAIEGEQKKLISTINAYSFNLAQSDPVFASSLLESDILLPDGISIVIALRLLKGYKLRKIAGQDLFNWELERLNDKCGSCFFLGSSENTLHLIKHRIEKEYPNVIVKSYSPPFKNEFSIIENDVMIKMINDFTPDVLFIGMTAPKQEKWAFGNQKKLNCKHICCIGAVFDFYAGTVTRAPEWIIGIGFEWLYRLLKEPRRLWKRYLIGNIRFIKLIIKEWVITKFSANGL